jgi:hypothetical protein
MWQCVADSWKHLPSINEISHILQLTRLYCTHFIWELRQCSRVTGWKLNERGSGEEYLCSLEFTQPPVQFVLASVLGVTAVRVWSWSLRSIKSWNVKCVGFYKHVPMRRHGVMLSHGENCIRCVVLSLIWQKGLELLANQPTDKVTK